jgi:hypothetical protein
MRRDVVELHDQAVANVDGRHGYAVEFAADPEAHRDEYRDEEVRLRAAEGRRECPDCEGGGEVDDPCCQGSMGCERCDGTGEIDGD